ncbi:MAG: hypothetical protein ACM3H8_10450 [Sphingobacteriales bacterium]
MRLSFKYIGLLTGLLLVITSFLFFGRHQDLYQILNIGGLAISFTFFLIILLRKGTVKSKIFWTIIVIVFVVLQRVTEPILIDTSYRIYIRQNKNILSNINNILIHKSGDITILNNNITDTNNQLTDYESNELIQGRKKLDVYIISKSEKGIYYGLWGFLDVRLRITYWSGIVKPDNNYRHLTGNWFH